MIRWMAAVLVVAGLAGCTSVNVRSVASGRLDHVCIVENERVIVDDFIDVVRDGFDRHGIATSLVSQASAPGCATTLTYTALRSWDFKPYLSRAELRLWQGGRQIGYGEYHLRGKGGFALTKWEGTRSKMDPVIDRLLEGVSGVPVAAHAIATAAPAPASIAAPAPQPVAVAPVPTPVPAAQVAPISQSPRQLDPAKRCDACARLGSEY